MNKPLVNRVARLGVLFWVIKILSTTVGETTADYVSTNLNVVHSYLPKIVQCYLPITKKHIIHPHIGF